MQTNQHTIKAPVMFSGIGIHSGYTTNLTCLPAPPHHGIKFQRMDIDEKPIIDAVVDYVVDATRSTTLRHENAYVDTVEHLLAAIGGLEIDNILIQVDGSEVPILDGSALPFVKAFQQVGFTDQGVERHFFHIQEPIYYKDNRSTELSGFPAEDYKVTVMLDYENNLMYNQHAHLTNVIDFATEIAPNRTFSFLSEIQSLYEHGLIQGGALDNALVIVDKRLSDQELEKLGNLFSKKITNLSTEGGILNNVKMHFPNELARHKLLDLVGDLTLLGRPFKGYIVGYRPGHAANIEFVRKLRKAMQLQENLIIPTYDPAAEPVFSIKDITRLLPHRYPFQLIDKIIHLDKKTIIGIKNVTINEPFFQGHFPDNPVMPGVLQIEAMVQTGGVLVLNDLQDPHLYSTYFLAIENCRFKKIVLPGDTLIIDCELMSIKRGIAKMHGRIFVGNKLVCEALMTAQISKPRE